MSTEKERGSTAAGAPQCFWRRYGVLAAAVALYLLSAVSLYVLQVYGFGGGLKTGFGLAALLPPLYGCCWLLADRRQAPAKPRRKTDLLNGLLLAALTVLVAVFLLQDRYLLRCWQYFGVLLGLGGLMLYRRRHPVSKLSAVAVASFLGLLLSTGLYFAVLRPTTLPGARALLAAQGYRNLQFGTHCMAALADQVDYTGGQQTTGKQDEALGLYLFTARRGSQQYGVFVSVAHGRPVGSYLRKNNPAMDYFERQGVRWR